MFSSSGVNVQPCAFSVSIAPPKPAISPKQSLPAAARSRSTIESAETSVLPRSQKYHLRTFACLAAAAASAAKVFAAAAASRSFLRECQPRQAQRHQRHALQPVGINPKPLSMLAPIQIPSSLSKNANGKRRYSQRRSRTGAASARNRETRKQLVSGSSPPPQNTAYLRPDPVAEITAAVAPKGKPISPASKVTAKRRPIHWTR